MALQPVSFSVNPQPRAPSVIEQAFGLGLATLARELITQPFAKKAEERAERRQVAEEKRQFARSTELISLNEASQLRMADAATERAIAAIPLQQAALTEAQLREAVRSGAAQPFSAQNLAALGLAGISNITPFTMDGQQYLSVQDTARLREAQQGQAPADTTAVATVDQTSSFVARQLEAYGLPRGRVAADPSPGTSRAELAERIAANQTGVSLLNTQAERERSQQDRRANIVLGIMSRMTGDPLSGYGLVVPDENSPGNMRPLTNDERAAWNFGTRSDLSTNEALTELLGDEYAAMARGWRETYRTLSGIVQSARGWTTAEYDGAVTDITRSMGPAEREQRLAAAYDRLKAAGMLNDPERGDPSSPGEGVTRIMTRAGLLEAALYAERHGTYEQYLRDVRGNPTLRPMSADAEAAFRRLSAVGMRHGGGAAAPSTNPRTAPGASGSASVRFPQGGRTAPQANLTPEQRQNSAMVDVYQTDFTSFMQDTTNYSRARSDFLTNTRSPEQAVAYLRGQGMPAEMVSILETGKKAEKDLVLSTLRQRRMALMDAAMEAVRLQRRGR